MRGNKAGRVLILLLAALLMAVAPCLDMAPAARLRPDATYGFGHLYQWIGRTADSLEADAFVLTVLFLAALWFAKRYLFHKPRETGAGEYALTGFGGVMMLLCACMRATGSVRTIWENAFQLAKALWVLAGMWLILLCAQRALTGWHFRFDDLPVIGLFASMGFCVYVMLGMSYLCWIQGRRRALLVQLPALLTALRGMFCPEVYVRYLPPTMAALPLWFGAFYVLGSEMGAAERKRGMRSGEGVRGVIPHS